MVQLLLIQCWLLLPLWDSLIVLCFAVGFCYWSMLCCALLCVLLVLHSSRWGRKSWLLCFVWLPGVSLLLCGSSSRWHVFDICTLTCFFCSLWLWYCLIIHRYYCCVRPLFCYAVLCVLSSFAFPLLGKRKRVGCSTLYDFLMSWGCYCSFTHTHSGAVCSVWLLNFLVIFAYFLVRVRC